MTVSYNQDFYASEREPKALCDLAELIQSAKRKFREFFGLVKDLTIPCLEFFVLVRDPTTKYLDYCGLVRDPTTPCQAYFVLANVPMIFLECFDLAKDQTIPCPVC